MKKIAILDDHSLFSSGLQLILEELEDEVVTESHTQINTLLSKIEQTYAARQNYDLILLDYYLPFKSFVENIQKIKTVLPNTPIVVISASTSLEDKNIALQNGAALFIHKNIEPDDLLRKISELFKGKIISQVESSLLFPIEGEFQLTERQIEILTFVCKGYSNKTIANELNVSAETVKTHLKNIYQRIHVNNRIEAIDKFRKHGFMPRFD